MEVKPLVAWAAARARRQREQWQLCATFIGSVTWKATAPQRQLPRTTPSGAGSRGFLRDAGAPRCGGVGVVMRPLAGYAVPGRFVGHEDVAVGLAALVVAAAGHRHGMDAPAFPGHGGTAVPAEASGDEVGGFEVGDGCPMALVQRKRSWGRNQ